MKQRIPTPSVVFFRSLMEDAQPQVPAEGADDDGPTVVAPMLVSVRPTPMPCQGPNAAAPKRRAVSRITWGGGALVAVCAIVLTLAAFGRRGHAAVNEGQTVRFQAAHAPVVTTPLAPPGPPSTVDTTTTFMFTKPLQIEVTSRPTSNAAPPPPPPAAKPSDSATTVLATALAPKRPTGVAKTPAGGAPGGSPDADAARLQQLAAQQLGASLGR